MHIELAPKYKSGLNNVITHLGIDAHIINSFNASGETITLSASKEDLEKILEATEEGFQFDNIQSEEDPSVTLEGLRAIIRDHLANRI